MNPMGKGLKTLTKRIKVARKHMKSCYSTSLVTRKMQLTTAISYRIPYSNMYRVSKSIETESRLISRQVLAGEEVGRDG